MYVHNFNFLPTDGLLPVMYRGFFVEHYRREYNNRTHKKCTQEHLADAVGISLGTYKRYISGDSKNNDDRQRGFTDDQLEIVRQVLKLPARAFASEEAVRNYHANYIIKENDFKDYLEMKQFFYFISYLDTNFETLTEDLDNDRPSDHLFLSEKKNYLGYYFRHDHRWYLYDVSLDTIYGLENKNNISRSKIYGMGINEKMSLYTQDGGLNKDYLKIFLFNSKRQRDDWQRIIINKFKFEFMGHEIDPILLLGLYKDKSLSADEKMRRIKQYCNNED